MPTKIILIAAVAANGCIGDKGKLPWHIPDELAIFRKLTNTSPLIMGRRTFESMPKSVWRSRMPFVLTSDPTQLDLEHVESYWTDSNLTDLIEMARSESKTGEAFIIGGRSLYAAALGHKPDGSQGDVLVDEAIISHLTYSYVGDTHFPYMPSQLLFKEQLVNHKLFNTNRYVRDTSSIDLERVTAAL